MLHWATSIGQSDTHKAAMEPQKTPKQRISCLIVSTKVFLNFQISLSKELSYSKKFSLWKHNVKESYNPNFKVLESLNIKAILRVTKMQGWKITIEQVGKVKIHLQLEPGLSHVLQWAAITPFFSCRLSPTRLATFHFSFSM